MRDPAGDDLPGSVLFACNLNVVRSPMAAALMTHLYGARVKAASVGLQSGAADPFVAEVLREMGLRPPAAGSRTFADLEGETFDLVVSLSVEAHEQALMLNCARAAVYWPVADPTLAEGSREQRLAAYRALRDDLLKRLRARFGTAGGA